jgi:hypothetical protein
VRFGGGDVPEKSYPPRLELWNKTAAPWVAGYEELANKDWRGLPIVPPRATWEESLKARGQHLLSKAEPFGLKPYTEEAPKGTALGPISRGLGFHSSGAYIQNPEGFQRGQLQRELDDWLKKENIDNAVRRNQGLPELPKRPLPEGYELPWWQRRQYAGGGPVTGYQFGGY